MKLACIRPPARSKHLSAIIFKFYSDRSRIIVEIKHVSVIELDIRKGLDTLRQVLDHFRETAHNEYPVSLNSLLFVRFYGYS